MRILKLSVENFGCVERADIELGAGLNILYGPNDLGKSSLVDAIRCALLLQSTSSDIERFVPWRSGRAPKVALVYWTEAQRFWQVSKTFDGTRGSALLETSRDGLTFSNECSGRRVDEEIRRHLCWGVAPPGGKGGSKGTPQAFLATALLARQGEVDELLALSLQMDSDESGRQKISAALQAIAQDPLFVRVLGEVQGKVDEAFTATGALRRGKNDALPKAREAVVKADADVSEWRRRADDTQTVRRKLADLAAEKDRRLGELEDRKRTASELGNLLQLARTRQEKEVAHQRALADVRRAEEARAAVAETERRESEIRAEVAGLDASIAGMDIKVASAEQELATARDALREQQSDARAQYAAARRAELESSRLSAEAQMHESESLVARAQAVGAIEGDVQTARTSLANHEAAAGRLAAVLAVAQAHHRAAADELKDIRGIALLRDHEERLRAVARAKQDRDARDGLQARIDAARAEAGRIRAALDAQKLPSTEHLATLKKLERNAGVAEAALAVGLAVLVRPLRPLEIEVARDGGAAEKTRIDTSAAFQASQELRLAVKGVAELIVSGGTEDARVRAATLRKQLEEKLRPVLDAAGAGDLSAVERMIQESASSKRMLEELERTLRDIEGRRRELGDVDVTLTKCEERAADTERDLASYDRARLERLSATSGMERAQERADRQRRLEEALRRFESEIRTTELELQQHTTHKENAQAQLDRAVRSLEEAGGRLGKPWQEVVLDGQSSRDAAQGKLDSVASAIRRLEDSASSTADEASRRVDAAEVALDRARTEEGKAVDRRDGFRQELAKLDGQMGERQQIAASFDVNALRTALARAHAELSATPVPPREVTPQELQAADGEVDHAEAVVRDVDREIHKTEGSLTLVDGSVADDGLADAQAALEAARLRHSSLEQEYVAWQLLRDTLLEAQREESTHLGRTLGEPVAAQFRTLTGGRYDGLNLGTNLETEGVVVAGAQHETDHLSVGTREQLATLFRLALAKQVGSLVVLDDQLVQSDRQRMSWFSTLLREVGRSIQVLVFTCREQDYVPEEYLPTDTPYRDVPELGLRAIDLNRAVKRAA